jgi:hypothetical protein
MKNILLTMVMLCAFGTIAAQNTKLTGTVIGTTTSIDYTTNKKSTTVNTREMAFDDNSNTFFSSYDLSYTWVGLDLGEPHVITRVSWTPARVEEGAEAVVLGVFEGANSPDFMDALPLYIITQRGTYGRMLHANVECSKGFRYVRYVGPSESRCTIAELAFYGHADEGNDSTLYRLTNLPTVSIHTVDGVIPYDKEHQIDAILTVISDKDKKLLQDSGTVRLRGNGSLTFPKKPYRIKFNNKKHVLDSPAKAKKWALVSNYSDKTLFRNQLAFELSRGFGMPYTPYSQPVDVLLNGEYKGCFLLCDQIDVRKHRVEVEEMTPEDNSGSALTGGYLVEVDAYARNEISRFTSKQGNPVTIQYPDDEDITTEQYKYIVDHFNKMEANWKTYLDTSTFLRHFLVGELSGNTDTYWSVYMYKHRDNDTIYTGPVWDFDLAFENDNRTYPINRKSDFIYRSGGSVTGNMKVFVDRICIQDADARSEMLEIWDNARRGDINEQHLVDFIGQQEEYLQQAQKLNFMRWPVMLEKVQKNPVIWGSYEAEVQNVRRFLKERLLWMDNKLGYTYNPDGIAEMSIDYNQPYQVFSLSGQPCTGHLNNLPKGIYIVKQGRMSRKVQVRN